MYAIVCQLKHHLNTEQEHKYNTQAMHHLENDKTDNTHLRVGEKKEMMSLTRGQPKTVKVK